MANTHTVNINNMAFNPPSLGITKGDTVVWVNQMAMDHTATADNGEFDSDVIPPNGTYTYTFPTGHASGPVPYSCAIHSFMTGTVNVTWCGVEDCAAEGRAFVAGDEGRLLHLPADVCRTGDHGAVNDKMTLVSK
jgi:hypothetical protein